jgi:hypothetical protein
MTPGSPSSFRDALEQSPDRASALASALAAGDSDAAWRVKWEHPRFRNRSVSEVRTATLGRPDAELVIAREQGFETWADLLSFVDRSERDEAVARFERAVDAIVSGDLEMLRALLRDDPALVHARSARRHHATLLHYLGANGVEGYRQKTPANAVLIAAALLEAGALPDAVADLYDAQCTTMSLLVSSSPPHEAGLQSALAETLLDHGAALGGPGSKWGDSLMTALAFGYLDTARVLAERGAPAETLAAAAGLGRLDEVTRLLTTADSRSRQIALALAAQHGHAAIVRRLLDLGEDPNRYNPDGFHGHSTPLHQAVAAGHDEVVRVLVERGARLDLADTIYSGTPLDWAVYCKRPTIADYLRAAESGRPDPA